MTSVILTRKKRSGFQLFKVGFFLPVPGKTGRPAQPRTELCFAGRCGWVEFWEDEIKVLSKPFCPFFNNLYQRCPNPTDPDPRAECLTKAQRAVVQIDADCGRVGAGGWSYPTSGRLLFMSCWTGRPWWIVEFPTPRLIRRQRMCH